MKILYNKRVHGRWRTVFLLLAILFLGIGLLLVLLNRIKIKDKGGSMKKLVVRQPAVAGQFYPRSEKDLRAMAEKFLLAVRQKEREADSFPRILIVPHAGWEYSGQTAAFGFTQIENSDLERVILIGPSHQTFFKGVVIDDSDYWQTPLGQVAVDKTLVDEILAPQEGIVANHEAHENEHGLEVELPFLQIVLSDFKIIPVLIGQANEGTLELLAQKIAANFDEKTLLVISSDLSHYPDMETAQVVDQQTVKAILGGDKDKFVKSLIELADEYSGVDTFACGSEAIKVGLMVVQNLGVTESKLLAITNSGEVTNQGGKVVGYAAIGFYRKIPKLKNSKTQSKLKTEKELDENQQRKLLEIARQTLESYLKSGKMSDIKIEDEALEQKRGVFVTLKKDDQLRGCIGNFFSQKFLYQEVADMAVSAAVGDSRFPPLQYNELKDIKIEISVLSPMRKVDSLGEIELGKNGVYLKYGQRTATFLPQVATETGWTKEEFLSQLCAQKAGLPSNCYLSPQAELSVYTAQVFGE